MTLLNRFFHKRTCRTCGKSLVLCPGCGGDDNVGGGNGQSGFYICQNGECSEYEFCCGC